MSGALRKFCTPGETSIFFTFSKSTRGGWDSLVPAWCWTPEVHVRAIRTPVKASKSAKRPIQERLKRVHAYARLENSQSSDRRSSVPPRFSSYLLSTRENPPLRWDNNAAQGPGPACALLDEIPWDSVDVGGGGIASAAALASGARATSNCGAQLWK